MTDTWIVLVVLVGSSVSFPTGEPPEVVKTNGVLKDVKLAETNAGDMVLDDDQVAGFQHQGHAPAKRNARDFAGKWGWDHRWVDGKINYVMGSSLSSYYDYKSDIRTSIEQIEAATCLQFTDITYDSSKQGDKDNFIVFERHSGVCNSEVGRRLAGASGYGSVWTPYGAKQTINLGPKGRVEISGGYIINCNTGVPTVLHELGHAIGFYHEHNRWDRDDYITVNWGNTNEDPYNSIDLGKLEKGKFTDYGVPYDYRSIMHYAETSSSKNGGVVFQTKSGSSQYQKVMGHGTKLSFGDIKLLNLMYSCKDKAVGGCGRTCDGDGFVDRFCVCQCPTDDGLNVQRCSEQGTVSAVTAPPATQPPPVTEATSNEYRCDQYCNGKANCECTCTVVGTTTNISCVTYTYGK